MRTHVFWYPGTGAAAERTRVDGAMTTSELPSEPEAAAVHIGDIVQRDMTVDTLVFWDPALGCLPLEALPAFAGSRDDVWHPGSRLTGSDEPDLIRYIQPLWAYRADPPPDQPGRINWKLDLRASLVRADTPRRLGTLASGHVSLAGAAREMGYRWLARGAICRQQPELIGARPAAPVAVPVSDRYRLIVQQFGMRWARYVLIRRLLGEGAPSAELRAFRRAVGASPLEGSPADSVRREIANVALPRSPAVSVVLPTYGRYRYVAEVLEDLRHQTVRPTQIIIADGNVPDERRPEVYQGFADLPLDVQWIERTGICAARNMCLERVNGDFVWFVDDDSRLPADNLEQHLRVLAAYGADVSVGPAVTKARPELAPAQREIVCTFMDCGTTVCRRDILEKVGGFDLQFNEHLPSEDAEIGIRFIKTGGLMLNNPLAKRFHYLAPVGGARTSKNNLHRWRRLSLVPRPSHAVYYLAKRHFEPRAVREAVLQAWVLVGLRRRTDAKVTPWWWLRTAIAELLLLPLSLIRLYRSIRLGRELVRGGPRIPQAFAE